MNLLATEYELPLQFPWGELPRYPHVVVTPKVHDENLPYYTSGFK